jgi:hypothetical protein
LVIRDAVRTKIGKVDKGLSDIGLSGAVIADKGGWAGGEFELQVLIGTKVRQR